VYFVGYYPTNDRRDGTFRKVEVRLTGNTVRQAALTVRTRAGYVAPKA
jgi:hypothetical protein